jgi:hypothetical protein
MSAEDITISSFAGEGLVTPYLLKIC